jgi:hypothetical protein
MRMMPPTGGRQGQRRGELHKGIRSACGPHTRTGGIVSSLRRRPGKRGLVGGGLWLGPTPPPADRLVPSSCAGYDRGNEGR